MSDSFVLCKLSKPQMFDIIPLLSEYLNCSDSASSIILRLIKIPLGDSNPETINPTVILTSVNKVDKTKTTVLY